ncbi:flavodoxin family protein [Salmonirosea aquatica]|uniref:Flavodoxin-like domain-containing protein n=1 Tax=Salmonirosea aquatica TaxID=2654236 RepID=A0A7C9FAN2_9BACT|nr:hypothetical protein [Cytophagaceae bacterium SJW1-29]
MKASKIILLIIPVLLLAWLGLTFWVEYSGEAKVLLVGSSEANHKALIVYNPDPIYNLDEQVCKSFAEGLSRYDYQVVIATVKAAEKDPGKYDCFVFCANTYNWAPDRSIRKFIAQHPMLKGSRIVAITLGSGTTGRSQRILEESISAKGATLLGSEEFWLLRPNDENRMEEANVTIAVVKARLFGSEIGRKLTADSNHVTQNR